MKILNLQVCVDANLCFIPHPDETKPFYSLVVISGWKQNKLERLFQRLFAPLQQQHERGFRGVISVEEQKNKGV